MSTKTAQTKTMQKKRRLNPRELRKSEKFIKFTVVTAMLVGAVWYGYQNGKADGFEKAMELERSRFHCTKKEDEGEATEPAPEKSDAD